MSETVRYDSKQRVFVRTVTSESTGFDRDYLYERRLREQQPQQTVFKGEDAIRRLNDAIKPVNQQPNQNPKTYAVDFDGVLHEHHTGDGPGPLTNPLSPGIQFAKRIKAAGHKLVILTARPQQQHETIKGWLKGQGVKADDVTNIKPPAAMYVDDRAVRWPRNAGATQAVSEGGPGSGPKRKSGGGGKKYKEDLLRMHDAIKNNPIREDNSPMGEKKIYASQKTSLEELTRTVKSTVGSGGKQAFEMPIYGSGNASANTVLGQIEEHLAEAEAYHQDGNDHDAIQSQESALQELHNVINNVPYSKGARAFSSKESRIDSFGENGGDGSMNMLDGHRYKSLATHESTLLEHGTKGQKWGVKHHKEKGGKGGSSTNGLGLKTRDVRNQAQALSLVKEAREKTKLKNLMFRGDEDEVHDEDLEKVYDLQIKLSDLKDKLSDLKQEKYEHESGSKGRQRIMDKIDDTKERISDLKDQIKGAGSDFGSGDPRKALFAAAGVDEKGYIEFADATQSWANSGKGKDHPIRKAAAEIAKGNVKSDLAKCLLVENAINRLYYGERDSVKLYRSMDGKLADKLKEAKKSGKNYMTVPFNHADHWSTDHDSSRQFGSAQFRKIVPSQDILLSYRTNSMFDDYAEEKEVVPLIRDSTIKFAIRNKPRTDKGAWAQHFGMGDDDD
jgi:hypothetical protein